MTALEQISYKKIPVLKLMILMMVIVSIIFQIILSYVNAEPGFTNFIKNTVITIVVQTIFCCTVYFLQQLFAQLFNKKTLTPLRYSLEFSTSVIACFYILIAVYFIHRGTRFTLAQLFTHADFRLHVSINMVAVLFVFALGSILNLYQLMLEKSAQAALLQQQYAQVRLLALKNQVNPHFLFNSLSVLSSLVHVNAAASEKFIVQLAKAYRYILEQKDTELVSLKEELDFLDAYFYLLTIRFENKIILKKNIILQAEDWYLPPLTLQLLVENAVKHNKMSASKPLLIELNSFTDSLHISNTINTREQDIISTGIGLENIKKRMAFLTEKKVSILNTGTTFSVIIPMVKKIKF